MFKKGNCSKKNTNHTFITANSYQEKNLINLSLFIYARLKCFIITCGILLLNVQ